AGSRVSRRRAARPRPEPGIRPVDSRPRPDLAGRGPTTWPVPGGLLERFGLSPDEIEARSRGRARELVGARFTGLDAELAAAMVYAAGDPDIVAELVIG